MKSIEEHLIEDIQRIGPQPYLGPPGLSEREVRRRLDRAGLALRKDRARYRSFNHAGGYMVVSAWRNLIVAGERFNLTLEEAASHGKGASD